MDGRIPGSVGFGMDLDLAGDFVSTFDLDSTDGKEDEAEDEVEGRLAGWSNGARGLDMTSEKRVRKRRDFLKLGSP